MKIKARVITPELLLECGFVLSPEKIYKLETYSFTVDWYPEENLVTVGSPGLVDASDNIKYMHELYNLIISKLNNSLIYFAHEYYECYEKLRKIEHK